MSFKRYAKSIISRTGIEFDEWMSELREQHESVVPSNYVNRVAKTVLRKCDPKQYLLSHATIVASVDTYAPKNVKLGRQMNRGIQIDVRWPDYRIKPECHEIINNNADAWNRSLLLSTYRTFVGASNYLEHIQIPELSKGFIVDAIARDLGKSCYIDILVATDRKHTALVQDILSGKIDSLSMGCFVPGTKVYLGDGSTINIEDVRPDMTVLSQKGNPCRVDNLQIRENRWNVLTVKSVGLPEVSATDTHKFYIVRSESIEKDFVRNSHGHKSKPRVIERDYDFDYAQLGTLRSGDYLALPISQSLVEPDVSLNEARLLGLWIGDGWKFNNSHDSTCGIGFCMDETYSNICEDLERSLEQIAWKGRELHVAMGGNTLGRPFPSCNRRGAKYISITSRSIYHLIDKHTSGRTSHTKSIGASVMSWPREHQLAFLGGLIDSDGCVSRTKRGTAQVFISTRNESLAHQYMQILARCGQVSSFSRAERTGTKLLPNASGVDFQIRIRNDRVTEIPSLKIQSCKDEFKSVRSGRNDRWLTDKYLYTKVLKIKKINYEGFVYDLQVDKDHSYIANGYGVSNCISLFTTCTKCGNVAADDSQLCACLQYEGKGSKFTDEDGVQHPIAELIGHVSVPNSNQFIEASWVRNPAFRGAVRRNFLNADQTQLASKIDESKLVYEVKSSELLPDGVKKAASLRKAQEGQDSQSQETPDLGDSADQSEESQSADQAESTPSVSEKSDGPKPDKFDDLLQKAQEGLLEIFVKNLSERLQPKPEDVGSVKSPVNLESSNESLVHSASFEETVRKTFPKSEKLVKWATRVHRVVHVGGTRAIRAAGLTPKDLIILSWIEDRCRGRNYSANLYKISMQIGPISNFPSTKSFLAACKAKLGKDLNSDEQRFLMWKGRIASAAKF